MIALHHGDCLEAVPAVLANSVDAVITDPPYPEIDRDYGRMSEVEWFAMMEQLIPEIQRVLKPAGSAVFILQPNSEKVGRMRAWLWRFMAYLCEEWNVIQDAYWWNIAAMPTVHSAKGLMRPSLKYAVWCGPPDCYRNQDAVLWQESHRNTAQRLNGRTALRYTPSGAHLREAVISAAAERRGGVTPFNLLPVAAGDSTSSAGAHGHGAGTPYALADWWTRYICPHGGTVLDCFAGTGTIPLAADANDCNAIGIEKMPKYYEIMRERVELEATKPRTLRMEMA
jgi:DNA modification methylase